MKTWSCKGAALLAAVALLCSGCGEWKSSEGTVRDNEAGRKLRAYTTDNGVRVHGWQLATIADQAPGVALAYVSMHGREVLVGIKLEETAGRKLTEKRVTSALQWQYPEYAYYVTGDETLTDRIKALSEAGAAQASGSAYAEAAATKEAVAEIVRIISADASAHRNGARERLRP